MKHIYEIDLITWGRASIADNTNENVKTARLLNMPLKSMIGKMIKQHHT